MASPAPESLLLEDFGQKVDLTRRIREVLVNYPEGTTVLKELIQNADDAGATRVCLCLDRRVHGSDTLLSGSLSQWQGPALLAFNDAVFSEDDFVSISRIGGSAKHGQTWKTGRFGVGFNSVYHLTDLPSFVSGKYVVLFDPQGAYLPNVSASNPGKRIDFVSSSAISIFQDQFYPYCAFGCNMKSPFLGTLFRLPLRNTDQAARSRLSRQAYFEDDISLMFDQLFEEGIFSLLFLKSVLSIEMYTWDSGAQGPRKLYSCLVKSPDDEIIWHRKAILRLSKAVICNDRELDAFTLDFLSKSMVGNELKTRSDRFFIVQSMMSASSRIGSFAASASKEYDIHLLPWASVAAHISDDWSEGNILKLGQAFCFLPLPVRTGLAVQVNGYFEVSSNRRGIWYGADMDRSGKVRSAWNRLLLEDVVTPAFRELLLGLREILGSTKSYYKLWPSGSFEEPWHILVDHVYRSIKEAPVLHSEVEGGKWISPMEAFLHDEEFSKSRELYDTLLQLGLPVVRLPKSTFQMFVKYACDLHVKVITPDVIRHFLRRSKMVEKLRKSSKLVLLEYCLDDLIDEDVGEHASDLPLVPLANGEFGLLCKGSEGVSYFMCNEMECMLLQNVTDKVIDRTIPLYILNRLCAIAESSNTNLTIFSLGHLLHLFPRLVPAGWKYKSKVVWDPESYDDPSSSWFLLLWQYLQSHCENLSLFGDWPILPSTSGHLYRVSTQSKLIEIKNLPTSMRGILEKIGCKVLNHKLAIQHPDLSRYVSDATYEGVLKSILDAASSNGATVHNCLHNLNAEEKDALRTFLLEPKWYIGMNQIGDSYMEICKRLTIYRNYGEGSDHETSFSDLVNPPKYLPPLDVPVCLLGGEFILSSSSSEEDILLRHHHIERMGKARFYKQKVFNRLHELQAEIRDHLMVSILQNLPQLCIEDALFREALKSLEFVPVTSGVLRSPAVLYDPRNEELCALLDDSDSFPCGAFEEYAILDMLQGLGLRNSVSPETVLQSARQVEQLVHKNQEKAHSQGKVLLAYLEANAVKWLANQSSDCEGTVERIFSRAATAFRPRNLKSNLEKFWDDLKMICWCPVLVSAPFQTLPWPAVTSVVAPPKLVRLQKDMWLVSASMRILDGECSSTALAYNLGWLSPPGGSAIAAQLLELGKNNEVIADQVLRRELALAMPRIYSILAVLVGSDEMEIVKAVLEASRWIWVGDGFATSDEVVLDGPLHLAPYIRVIPTDLAVFKGLFLELGIREYMKASDFANILCRMAGAKGASPLNAQEIRAAILIVQHLAEVPLSEKVVIYLPDASGRLSPSSDLVYNDAPWLAGDDCDSSYNGESAMVLSTKRPVQKFVHGNISNEVAEKLGVCSLRRLLLAQSADSMNLSLSGAAEAFGQHEALTTRLKHILEMYADGPGILFELVQNAEDAGASEVIFLLDRSQYGTSSLLSPEMADWQGPALYCFNDSVFTPQDLYAISRIGQESKLEKPLAIGRFGLGFNSVYHFTDIPAFVSGENIVMFDPHASHLPGISPSHPGLRIKFVGKKILDQFPDQFAPFLHFGCDLQHAFPSTLFRFPLRNATVASRSQIKKEGYAPRDVLSLFASFSGVVSDALLFLHNVKTISTFVKEGYGYEMQLLHRVHRDCINVTEGELNSSCEAFRLVNENRLTGINKDQLLKKLNRVVDKDLPYRCQKIVVTEEKTSGCMSHRWITGECLGSGMTGNDPKPADKLHMSIPWACVAAYIDSVETINGINCLKIDGNDASNIIQSSENSIGHRKNFEGRAFCFLPLPITTGFPAHINAYFALSSNRRDLWFGTDMAGGGKIRSDWNLYLLKEVVAPAYGRLLEKIALEIGPCDVFFSFWPITSGLEPWASLVQKVYQFIADYDIRVLYTKARGGQWITTKQAIFPDFAFSKVNELVDVLSNASLPLINISKSLADQFMEACPSLHILTPKLLRTLLIRRKRGFRDRNTLMMTLDYCLLDLEVPFDVENLYGLPLLPLADGSSTSFEKNGATQRIYIARANEYGLLKDSLPQQLVGFEIPEVIHKKLCYVAESKKSNISLLSCNLLEKLFFKLLPTDWHLARKVPWNPGQQGHPTMQWMQLLWSYLDSCCNDLSLFSKWPILPVGDRYLMQLDENSNVIKDDGWTENISSLLLKVGCLFLNRELPIKHQKLEKYVQPPTAIGVLNAFFAVAVKTENLEGLFSNASEGELHELRSFILQSKWFSEEEMNEIHIDIIKSLPMFESYKSRKLVSLRGTVKWLKPDGIRDDFLNDDFIRIDAEREKVILKNYIQIQEPSKVEFYKAYVLNRISEFVLHPGVLSAILYDLKVLIDEDCSIKSELSSIPFVLAGNGSWKQPSRLYDCRVPWLQRLLHKDVYFPSENFSDPEILDLLVSLGLKRSLDFSLLLDAAKTVSLLHDSGESYTSTYGRKLLLLLDDLSLKLSAKKDDDSHDELQNDMLCLNSVGNHDSASEDFPGKDAEHSMDDLDYKHLLSNLGQEKSEDDFWSELKSIPWCPVCPNPPVAGIPWLEPGRVVATPDNVRPKSQMWMVSATMHLLDIECCSSYLQHKFGWMDRLNIGVLSTQLVELSKSYRLLKSQSKVESDLDAMLQKEIPILYSKLQEYIGTDDFSSLKTALSGIPWVWVGDDFISTDVLAFDSPLKFTPYLYVVPSELSHYRELLQGLGVRRSFDIEDYCKVLQRLQKDVKGSPLSADLIGFVRCVLEAVAECFSEKSFLEVYSNQLLIPDSAGFLTFADDLVYNDAPWLESSPPLGKQFVHQSITHDLANRLGVKLLRCISLVDDNVTKDLPCMDFPKIKELLSLYGNNDFLLFDLLELADCCKVKKLHLIFDKREHSRKSLLQHNLADFQGPALIAILEGANLSRDEICSLQLQPPWRIRGDTLNYGLGLLSCYFICDLLSVVSSGCFYMFDPQGLALSTRTNDNPAAKMFSLTGTNLIQRFTDQFSPMLIYQDTLVAADSTIIRMPLSSECLKDGFELGLKRIKKIFDRFLEHSSKMLVFLKSVSQVSFSTWDEGSAQPRQNYGVHVDPSSAIIRNPFSEKKWRKFQISRLFSSSNSTIKSHTIDVNVNVEGSGFVDRWLVVLSMGSGQTRNMALDRRYLAYDLTPVGGVAAHISRNGHPVEVQVASTIMSPMPLSSCVTLPVIIVGCFLVRHNGGRFLFKYQDRGSFKDTLLSAGDWLVEAWNRELMACVRDSYIEMVSEMQKLRKEPLSSAVEGCSLALSLKAYGNQLYSFWPKSTGHASLNQPTEDSSLTEKEMPKADWECLIDQVVRPFYTQVAYLPLWELYSGNMVKADEGMFLAQPGNGVAVNLLPTTVCSFVKEHYPVFSVPWELVAEIQAVGIPVREVKPKMVRDLLRTTSSSIVLKSVDTYVDVLEYCLSDIRFPGSSNLNRGNESGECTDVVRVPEGPASITSMSRSNIRNFRGSSSQPVASSSDAFEMMASLGKALFDIGRGVVEDIGRTGGPISQISTLSGSTNHGFGREDPKVLAVVNELRGLPCPTATNHLARLGVTDLWIGNEEQQTLMLALAAKFIHLKVLKRQVLVNIFSNCAIQRLLKLKSCSVHLLASNMRLLFRDYWVNHVMESDMAPWFSWETSSGSSGDGGPSPEWIRLFWKNFKGPSEDLSFFADWPLIPAFLGRRILCRVREKHLIFLPPVLLDSSSGNFATDADATEADSPATESSQPYVTAFELAKDRHPWLLLLLNQCSIPVFDTAFIDCAAQCKCLPSAGQSLGQAIASKLAAAKRAGYFTNITSFPSTGRDELFKLLADDFFSNSSKYETEELEVLHSLPIYKTVTGSHSELLGRDMCLIPANSFLKPFDEHCLSHSDDSVEFHLLRALGVPVLHDQQILVSLGLPGFESRSQSEQEDILIYLYTNWQELQADSSVVEALMEAKFVRSADEFSAELFKPKDLLDPSDILLASVFSGERNKFPGERFSTEGWLRILKKTGLRSATDADIILECAKKVEFLASECIKPTATDDFVAEFSHSENELSVEIWTLAGSVIETILSNFAVFYSNQFCSTLGKIACVPAELGFPSFGGKKGCKRVLASYSEAILSKDWPLAWSVAPILSRLNVVPPAYSWPALQLKSPPAFLTVLHHLQVIGRNGGEDTLAHWSNVPSVMTIDEASCEVLKYLAKIWDSLSASDIKELQKVAFLPAANGTRLVAASSLFVRLSTNLSPFAFELPSCYLAFLKILKDLGLNEALSVGSAKDLLQKLQQACGYQRLNPNELRAVMEILHFLCQSSLGQRVADGLNLKSDVIVPDDGCRLVHANSCVYIDSHGSHYLKYIDTSRLRFVHPNLSQRLCVDLGIRKLSEVVVEEVDHFDQIQTIDCIGSVHLEAIKQRLRSRSFQAAVWNILSSTDSRTPIDDMPLESVERVLQSTAEKLQFVRHIYTRFLLLPKLVDVTLVSKELAIPGWEDVPQHGAMYYISCSNSCILVAEPPAYVSVLDVLARVLSHALGFTPPLPIASLFSCPEGSEAAISSSLRLCSDVRESRGATNTLVGKEILPQDALLVQIHPLRPFYRGEIVAWKTQNGEKLRYGSVPEDVRPSAGQAVYRFKVETAPGMTEMLLSSQVFSFRSVSREGEGRIALLPEMHPEVVDNRAGVEVPENSRNARRRSQQSVKDMQYGRVSPEELVQAVNEMLSAAGINMELEKQSLLQKTISLQEQLKESQAALLLEQERAEAAAKEADAAKVQWQCRVCLSNEVDMIIVPCGHVLCRRCSSAVSRCPFCRLQVAKSIRIFRP